MNYLDRDSGVRRREFLQAMTLLGSAILLSIPNAIGDPLDGAKLEVEKMMGGLRTETGNPPIAGAAWFTAETVGDGFAYRFPPGFLQKTKYLTADMLLDGNDLITFSLALQEGENGRTFHIEFGGLPQCSFRVRIPLDLVNQHRWGDRQRGGLPEAPVRG